MGNYYLGSIAEIVNRPSALTLSYLSDWISGSGSYGKALKLVGFPYAPDPRPLLESHSQHLVVNLDIEQAVLYDHTILQYRQQSNIASTPQLSLSLSKCFQPKALQNTWRLITVQANWLIFPDQILRQIDLWLSDMAALPTAKTAPKISQDIKQQLLPKVIAIGLIAEFFQQANKKSWLQAVGSGQLNDWLTGAIVDQQKVQTGEWSIKQYLDLYGIRADEDYELSCPRWCEIPDELSRRISLYKSPPATPKPESVSIEVKRLVRLINARSEARKHLLVHIFALRKQLISQGLIEDINHYHSEAKPTIATSKSQLTSGHGRAVSPGVTTGKILNIQNPSQAVPGGSICIFPNASPTYTFQFPQCQGIIFLAGGQTSHGAIVAREFGIPALIDPQIIGLPDGGLITINGATGEWSLNSA